MNEATHIDSLLLARYLSGEADATERATVDQWAASSTANAAELERLRAIWGWGSTGEALAELDVDVDAAWKRLDARMGSAEGKGRVLPFRPAASTWGWAAAAALVAATYLAASFFLRTEVQEYAAIGNAQTFPLQDSSTMRLSPGSQVAVRMGQTRAITLNGEAYFEVSRDSTRPFTVTANDLLVTVLGTGFSVTAFDTATMDTVRVRHGRVRVQADTASLELVAGESATFNKRTHRLRRVPLPTSLVWGDRIVQFSEAPLADVVSQLQVLYPVEIILGNDHLAGCRLTASFENEPIGTVLQVIAETFGLTLKEPSPGVYSLDGDGC